MAKTLSIVLLFATLAFGDASLIHEVEVLRDGLPLKDPSRQALTLRLADLMFDEASEVFKNPVPDDKDATRATKYRRQSIELYKEALVGGPGQYPAAQGDLAWKLKFQLARLYSDIGDSTRATALWKDIYSQNDLKDLKREASLRLAELAEQKKLPVSSAHEYYQTALDLCSGSDICSYVHFKRAWLYHNQNKNSDGISEMALALWDSKGQVREEALRDYVLFLSQEPGNGEKSILLVEPLAEKLARPRLFVDLMDGYFSSGNKVGGTNVLEYVQGHQPHLKYQVRLLEETYGLRNWDRFRYHLERIQDMPVAQMDAQEVKDSEKVLRRLLIQLDGERITKKEVAQDFKTATAFYLKLFPKSAERFKMQEGWLAAEISPDKKLAQLKIWIADPNTSPQEQIKLREHRVSVAQKLNNEDIVIEEMAALSQSQLAADKKREYQYLLARSYYSKKQLAEALPLFQALATFEKEPDTWAIRSQNLILDIYKQQKQYQPLIAQADLWLLSPTLKNSKSAEVKKELGDMAHVQEEARFQYATQLGKNKEALTLFKGFCENKKFTPKSCENAKVLAIQLKDQQSLLAILQILGLEKELAGEYEASGYFSKAAALQEKELKKDATAKDYLRLSLLYELAGETANQKRMFVKIVQYYQTHKFEEGVENLIYNILKEAKMIEPSLLKLPWSERNMAVLADELEAMGKGNKQTEKILTAYPYQSGPSWAKHVRADINALSAKHRKMGFYGRKAEKKFNTRIESIKALSTVADKYLPGSEPQFRVEILSLLEKDYNDLTTEIIQSPIPKELDPESVAQIQKSLEEMARPFKEKAIAYEKLKDDENKKMVAVDSKPKTLVAAVPQDVHAMAMKTLHENPTEETALKNLKAFYESQGQSRLAAYFQGRIEQLQKEEKKL